MADTHRPALGVPYARQTVIDFGDRSVVVATCPRCNQKVELTERKDFESMSGQEYADHYHERHAVDDGLVCIGGQWYAPIRRPGETEPAVAPERKDFIVKTAAILMVRVENVDTDNMAEAMASEWFDEQKIKDRLEDAIDMSDFYIVVDNGDWTVEED